MVDRAYTVKELDDLRGCVETKILYGFYEPPESGGCFSSGSFKREELDARVEAKVRTHMMAGHTADDLRASEKERRQRLRATSSAPLSTYPADM